MSEIKSLFEPKSVAIIGASHNSEKVGYKILENIIDGGYQGKIFPVNPKGGEILGRRVFKSVLGIRQRIDLAIIAIPAPLVFAVVKECAKKKIKFLVIISSGFSEAGNGEEEKRIADFAKANGVRILGPNIFGIYSAKVSLNATFGGKVAKRGNVAIISQSGALGIALMGETETEGMGLSSIVFEGNKSDLSEKDLLPYFKDDEQTKAIFVYLEGVEKGRELIEVLKKVTKTKPVIVIKAGTTKRGAEAAVSHTGSLAGEEKIFAAVMKQAGVLRTNNLQQAIHWAKYLSESSLPKGEETLIITNGGGMGILAADACERYKINLSSNEEEIKRSFDKIVPSFGSLKNPIDLTGQATVRDYRSALLAAADNSSFQSVICLGCETAVLDNKKLAGVFVEMDAKYRRAKKPIVFAFVGGREVKEKLLSLKEKGVPIFEEIEEAVSCLGALYCHQRNLGKTVESRKKSLIKEPVFQKIEEVVRKARLAGKETLSLSEARQIAELAGIALPKSLIANSLPPALAFVRKIGFPVVAKIVSPQIVHKTDHGGVFLNLDNEKELTNAYQLLRRKTKESCPDCLIEGVEIAEMISGGVEMVVGARKDRDFGTVIMVGLGGVYVEVLKDVSFRSFPATYSEVKEMIEELKSFPILAGIRGGSEKDIQRLAETLMRIGEIVERSEVKEIEINPLEVFEKGKGVKALDLRMLA